MTPVTSPSRGGEAVTVHTRLYELPDIYSELLGPDTALFGRVCDLVNTFLAGQRLRVLDPACGPGDWLWLFGQCGWALAGNDSSLAMVRAARNRLGAFRAELRHGDMRSLEFEDCVFDLATEVSGVLSELPDDRSLVAHLGSVARHLRSGGLYVFLLLQRVGVLRTPACGYRRGPVALTSGGSASIEYRFVGSEAGGEAVRVERHVCVDLPHRGVHEIVDVYTLQLGWPVRLPRLLRQVPAFELVTAVECFDEGDQQIGVGESIIVLRKR